MVESRWLLLVQQELLQLEFDLCAGDGTWRGGAHRVSTHRVRHSQLPRAATPAGRGAGLVTTPALKCTVVMNMWSCLTTFNYQNVVTSIVKREKVECVCLCKCERERV